jgi:hypothetical protein
VAAVVLLPASPASAWLVGSLLYVDGCHEPITAAALRNVRQALATAPTQAPTRDEDALFDDVQFSTPSDMEHDLGGMSLLLGVRDNDLKGRDPTDSLGLTQVHGNPANQEEHCLRSASQDGIQGGQDALDACRRYIGERATAALAGLDQDGTVDLSQRIGLAVYASIAGHVTPQLPVFYVELGRALHALEDGFTHTYRTADGLLVTAVDNWIDVADNHYDEPRDGPAHLGPLDECQSTDPLVQRNYRLATQAATELLTAALDPSLSHDQKVAEFDAITARYLTYLPGCSVDNHYCDAPEPKVTGTLGCAAGGGRARAPAWALAIVALGLALRRRRARAGVLALVLVGAVAGPARGEAPATPATPAKSDAQSAAEGLEPGRDAKTPTKAEVRSVREDKRLGSRWGADIQAGGSYARPAMAFSIGARYRLSERWTTGVDVAWNPWITVAPLNVRAGALNVYGTLILRFPMRFDRVNLRTSLHVGVSTLLFDVYGAPTGSVGPYVALSPLGLDFDLGGSWRIVLDPAEMAVAIPGVGALPLYYEQVRFLIGLQWGG